MMIMIHSRNANRGTITIVLWLVLWLLICIVRFWMVHDDDDDDDEAQ
jgi:hypothetical protein